MERTSMAMDVMTPRGKRGKNKTDSEKYHLITRATKIMNIPSAYSNLDHVQ